MCISTDSPVVPNASQLLQQSLTGLFISLDYCAFEQGKIKYLALVECVCDERLHPGIKVLQSLKRKTLCFKNAIISYTS